MKFTLFLLLLLSDVALSAQEVLLPFRENGLMGLKNPQERKVVEARYNSLHWQTDAYFTTVRKVWVSDTVEYEPGHVYILNDSINQSGLIYNGNEILKEEPFERYSILPGKCIIAHAAVNSHSLTRRQFKKYGLHRRFKALFDSHGNNLFPENFRHLEYLDTSGTHPRYKEQTRYVLIGFIEHDGSEGLLVVDAYKRIISQWLLRNEQDVRVKEGRMKGNGVVLSIKQRNGNSYNAMAKFDGKEYILSDMEVRDAVESVSEVHVKITDAESRVPVPEPPMEVSPRADDRVSLISYLQSGDSLMGTYSDGTRKLIQTVPGYKLLPVYARGSARGVPPLIFRSSAGRYAIFDSLNVKSVDYDQLFYAGKFILAQKQGLWGLLNAFGEPVVPILYDSITAIPFVYLNYSTSSPGTTVEVRSGKPSQSYSVYAKTLNLPVLAYAKGEATLLDGAGKRLLPGTYELIANNNLDFVQPAKTKFLIVRKSGKYGVVFPERLNSQTASQPPKVHWTHIPLSYVEDFYGIPGLRAFALFDEAFQLQEYVLEPGAFEGKH